MMQNLHKTGCGLALVWLLAFAVRAVAAPAGGASELLLATGELDALLKEPNVVLLDGEAEKAYQRGHIPGAVNLPIATLSDLASRRSNGYLMTTAAAEKTLGDAGIDNDTLVVVYGNEGKAAAGLWFALDFFGHKKVKILDGGFRKWVAEGRPVTQDAPAPAKKTYTAKARPEEVVTLDWMKKNLRNPGVVILDARSLNEYIGQAVPEGAARGGHIPGARNLEWLKLADEEGTFKSDAALRKVLKKSGITPDKQVITYCNSGIGRSSFLLMALKRAGYDNARVYTGSWEEWSSDPRLPIQK